MSLALHDERCPFFWWAQSVRHGVLNSGWPILWMPGLDRIGLNRYAGSPIPTPIVPGPMPPAEERGYWPHRLAEIEALQAGDDHVDSAGTPVAAMHVDGEDQIRDGRRRDERGPGAGEPVPAARRRDEVRPLRELPHRIFPGGALLAPDAGEGEV